MKRIIAFLTTNSAENISPKNVQSVLIDLFTVVLGGILLMGSIFNRHYNEEGIALGTGLFLLGIMIKVWRREINKN